MRPEEAQSRQQADTGLGLLAAMEHFSTELLVSSLWR